jgi:hypothetical protein
MKRTVAAMLTLAAVASLVVLSGAMASRGGPGDEGPEYVDELAPLDTCGTFLGGSEGTGVQLIATTYEFQQPSTLIGTPSELAPGHSVDFHWVHDFGTSPDPAVESPLVWDFGEDGVRKVRLYPSIDHGPLPEEGLETTVYSSANATGPWAPAELKKVYGPGWNPGWIADDYVSLWNPAREGSLRRGQVGRPWGTHRRRRRRDRLGLPREAQEALSAGGGVARAAPPHLTSGVHSVSKWKVSTEILLRSSIAKPPEAPS